MRGSEAVVILPSAASGRIASESLRRWLSRGEVAFNRSSIGPIENVIRDIDAPWAGAEGLGAFRYLGQTGRRPAGWIAAADPICLRLRMRDVVIDHTSASEVAETDLRALFDSLASGFRDVDGIRFESVGSVGYLFSDDAIATASKVPDRMQGRIPEPPAPVSCAEAQFQRINTEIQMLLHEHPVNLRRQDAGLPPINALWLWGGGAMQESVRCTLPPLFADDPLLSGYWVAHEGTSNTWPGSLTACCDASPAGFVAVPPAAQDALPDPWLAELRSLLSSGRVERLRVHFRDELTAKLARRDRFRFWRASAGPLQEHAAGE